MTTKLQLQSRQQGSLNIQDNRFIFTLDKPVQFNKLHLQACIMDNIFSNFAEFEQVLTITVAGIPYTIQLEDFITYDNLSAYWNAKSPNQNLKMVMVATNSWENVVCFKMQLSGGDVGSILSGSACTKLGLQTGVSQTIHKGVRVMNFSGPQLIHIALQGYDTMRHNTIQSTYQIPVNAGFGSVIQFADFQESEQAFETDTVNAVSQFIIDLTDERGLPLRTVRSTQSATGLQGLDFTLIIQTHLSDE